jgi:hypothetical protein
MAASATVRSVRRRWTSQGSWKGQRFVTCYDGDKEVGERYVKDDVEAQQIVNAWLNGVMNEEDLVAA